MRKVLLGVAAASAVMAMAASASEPDAPAPLVAGLIFGVDSFGDRPTLDPGQFFWGGRNFCWSDGGWRGPGYYWCGYARRRGYGWGGGYGWRGGGYGHGGRG